ncbi:hypothetical protein [Pseudomonas helleri]
MTGGGAAVTTNLNRLGLKLSSTKFPALERAVAGAECNTVIELKLEHHAA